MTPKILLALGLLTLVATGCSDDDPDKDTIESITVDNGGQRVMVGMTTKVTLTAMFTDGTTEDMSLRANWSTELGDDGGPATEFATVDGSGMVTGVAVGTYFVVADLEISDSDGSVNPFVETFTIGFDTVESLPGDAGVGDAGTDAGSDSGTATDAGTDSGAATDAAADGAADAAADAA